MFFSKATLKSGLFANKKLSEVTKKATQVFKSNQGTIILALLALVSIIATIWFIRIVGLKTLIIAMLIAIAIDAVLLLLLVPTRAVFDI